MILSNYLIWHVELQNISQVMARSMPRGRGLFSLKHMEYCNNRLEASRREVSIKALSRTKSSNFLETKYDRFFGTK